MKELQRNFIPGSKWIYIKLYTGSHTADKILVKDIMFIISKLKKAKLINKWYFIRYSDPDFHIRLRILANNDFDFASIVNIAFTKLEKLTQSGLIWKVQFDTYNRELERYGKILIEESETIFYYDSECILSIIKDIINCNNENYRWMISLKLIDIFLSDLKLNIDEKYIILNELCDSFKREFNIDNYNKKILSNKFREHRCVLESILDNSIEDENFKKLYLHIKKKTSKTSPVLYKLKSDLQNKMHNIALNDLIKSHIHMTLNRLFSSNNRLYEMVIYDFINKFYKSKIVRNKNKFI